MKFVSVMIKRSKLNGGNIRYSILPTNLFIHMKESPYGN
jgi:hypothetical protein